MRFFIEIGTQKIKKTRKTESLDMIKKFNAVKS